MPYARFHTLIAFKIHLKNKKTEVNRNESKNPLSPLKFFQDSLYYGFVVHAMWFCSMLDTCYKLPILMWCLQCFILYQTHRIPYTSDCLNANEMYEWRLSGVMMHTLNNIVSYRIDNRRNANRHAYLQAIDSVDVCESACVCVRLLANKLPRHPRRLFFICFMRD